MKTGNLKTHLLKTAICVLILLGTCNISYAQSPNAIPYQGVARDVAGAILPLQAISLDYIIHDGTAIGTVVFSETHNVTTTSLGLFNLNIGEGTPGTGTLATVDWGNGAKFIEVKLDGTSMGSSQLNSVPYALYAASSGGDFVDLTTDQNIDGHKTLNKDATINGITIGKGSGSESENTAVGLSALASNTTGTTNTAIGANALNSNTMGGENTAIGRNALAANTTGTNNTAGGAGVLSNNTTGSFNNSFGHYSLLSNTTGYSNSSVGGASMVQNTEGHHNTANGDLALLGNTTGNFNSGVGSEALSNNNSGNNNTALGANANVGAPDLENATAIGSNARVDTSNSLVLGNNANVGIGTTTPSQRLDVIGKVKITDGTQGVGKVLTSDATGVASWQVQGGTNSVIAFRAQSNVVQPLADGSTTIAYQDVILNDGGGFNMSNSIFTAPEDGIYHFDVSVHMNTGGNFYGALYIYLIFSNGQPGGVDVLGGPSLNITHLTISETVRLNAGDTVYPHSYIAGGPVNTLPTARFSGYKVN